MLLLCITIIYLMMTSLNLLLNLRIVSAADDLQTAGPADDHQTAGAASDLQPADAADDLQPAVLPMT